MVHRKIAHTENMRRYIPEFSTHDIAEITNF